MNKILKLLSAIPYTLYALFFLAGPKAYAAGQPVTNVTTAFGPFPADPAGFVGKLFGIILSIAAIGALGMIIYGGYQYSLSQGNQEKAQGAKEILTSAIAGLLFVIFSTVILQIIGVDVLQLKTVFGK